MKSAITTPLHIILPCLGLLPFFLIGCKDSPPGPLSPDGLDTTSHNFVFSLDTLGELNSVLYDVAIVNDTLAYAVGEMYLRDSTGQIDPAAYGVAIWNGYSWSLLRLFYGSGIPIVSIRGILISAATDIWLAAGSIFHWDGISAQTQLSFSRLSLPNADATVEKLGRSSSAGYLGVGKAGTIVQYNGATWQAMQSGTTLPLLDVFGRSGDEVYAVGGDRSTAVVLKYDGTRWTTLMNSYYFSNGFDSTELFRTQLYGHLNGAWVDESGTLYVVGENVYQMKAGQWGFTPGIADNYLNAPIFSRGFLTSIRGEADNDFVTVGERITVIHYNGATGIQVGPQFSFSSPVDFYGVDMKGPCIIGVGTSGGRAIAVRLQR